MAYYAALVSLVQLLEDIAHHGRYPNFLLHKHQIATLYEKFNLLQSSLDEFSPKNHQEESVDVLQRRIRDVAYKVQDIIESHISTQIHRENNVRGFTKLFRHLVSFFFFFFFLVNRHLVSASGQFLHNILGKEYQELEKVKEEVDSIVEELMRTKESLTSTREHWQQPKAYISTEASEAQALSGRNTMVGFEEQLTTIKGQLCGEPSKLEVISIVGMGGLGKTTLARNIFKDKLIYDRFDCRVWVTVSQDYHIRNILLAIAKSLNINKEGLHEVGEGVLEEYIYKQLCGRRYLVIMDDLWETRVWDCVKRIFPNDCNGSRVILTTRLLDIASYAGLIHEMRFLNENQSWNLLCDKVFCPPELEDIGKLIAKNCRGLPLAIVVVAGILSKVSKTQHDWEEIARNVSSTAIDQNDEHLSKILSLSYNHLPHHLKPCFLYLGGFPEDYEIPVSRLTMLWVAEGFLRPIGSKNLEEVAEKYLEDLVNRNLVLVTKKNSNGKFKLCIIHDLLRDLCSQIAHRENFLHCPHEKYDFHREPIGNVRRLYTQVWNDSLLRKYNKEHVSRVRSILFLDKFQVQVHFLSVVSDFKLLRILNTESMLSTRFPRAIEDLLHLRYVAFWAYPINIPPWICKLQNLQTLIVAGKSPSSLPSEIWKMPHLRHIMSWRITLAPIPHGELITSRSRVPLLGRLQTLIRVKDFIFTCNTIEMIPNLKKLKLEICVDFKDTGYVWGKFGLINLVHLNQLETLEIEFSSISQTSALIPENFAFPANLIKLSLISCHLLWKDMRAVGMLPNLQILKLRRNAFWGKEWEPVEGEFLKLKFLLMESLDELKYWRVENIHFPCLEQLHIRSCFRLEGIPREIGDIATLQCIEVYQCNSALGSSAFEILEEQRDQGNDDLQVRVLALNPNI